MNPWSYKLDETQRVILVIDDETGHKILTISFLEILEKIWGARLNSLH